MKQTSTHQGYWEIAYRLFLNQTLFICSYLVPHRKGLVIIGSGLGKRFMGNPKYLYLQLLKRRKCTHKPISIDFYWITENKDIYKEFNKNNWPVLKKFSLAGYWKLLRAEFLVIESGMKVTEVAHDVAYAWLFWGRFNVIQTWHGTALKLICLDSLRERGLDSLIKRLFYWATLIEYRNYDSVIAQSDYDKRIFVSAFAASNVPLLGSPRNDVLLNPSRAYQDLGKLLGLSKFERVILYAPTYRKSNTAENKEADHIEQPLRPFSDDYIADLNLILAERNWLLLVKKHHWDRSLKIQSGLSHVMELKEVADIQEILVHTDLLITDYSSVFFDFLQTDLPIIYYVYDLEDYTATRGFYMDFSENIPGPFAKNEHDLTKLIVDHDKWFADSKYQEKFQKFRSTYQKFDDGCATERVITYLQLRSAGIGCRETGKDTATILQ